MKAEFELMLFAFFLGLCRDTRTAIGCWALSWVVINAVYAFIKIFFQ